MSRMPRPGMETGLVSCEWLKAELDAPSGPLKLVEATWYMPKTVFGPPEGSEGPQGDFMKGPRLPGAGFFDIDGVAAADTGDTSGTACPGFEEMPPPTRSDQFPARHGTRKRLNVPKRGKAALRASWQGQGLEVLRGRSAWKRSSTASRRRHTPRQDRARGAMRRHREIRIELMEVFSQPDEEADFELFEEDQIPQSEASALHVSFAEGGAWMKCPEGSKESEIDRLSLASTRATPREDSYTPLAPLTRWELALLRAERSARRYAAVDLVPSRRCPVATSAEPHATKESIEKLLKEFQTKVQWKSHRASPSFELLRREFLTKHGPSFCPMLQKALGEVSLWPTPLNTPVQKTFYSSCCGLDGDLIPTFHGTRACSLSSIYQNGLVVPGGKNNVKVLHGSAYGVGIYTARVGNPWLSMNYSSGWTGLLVCGVLDNHDAQTVRHAGDAVVVFDERRVAPLFVAVPSSQPMARALGIMPGQAAVVHMPARRHQGPRTNTVGARASTPAAFLMRTAARKRRPRGSRWLSGKG
ncbi:Hypothetical protein (Fragment) [Durusdinium trenchii]|uniref:PARP catalytic domain-containing protein n=1 Tax=Durusdinium trenchii TaxID=1381693 RepID=A0ABP0M650_9DINO